MPKDCRSCGRSDATWRGCSKRLPQPARRGSSRPRQRLRSARTLFADGRAYARLCGISRSRARGAEACEGTPHAGLRTVKLRHRSGLMPAAERRGLQRAYASSSPQAGRNRTVLQALSSKSPCGSKPAGARTRLELRASACGGCGPPMAAPSNTCALRDSSERHRQEAAAR